MTFNPTNCPKCYKKLEVDFDYDIDESGHAHPITVYVCANCGWSR